MPCMDSNTRSNTPSNDPQRTQGAISEGQDDVDSGETPSGSASVADDPSGELLEQIGDALEALQRLDPADAAGPAAMIADALSKALEEEER